MLLRETEREREKRKRKQKSHTQRFPTKFTICQTLCKHCSTTEENRRNLQLRSRLLAKLRFNPGAWTRWITDSRRFSRLCNTERPRMKKGELNSLKHGRCGAKLRGQGASTPRADSRADGRLTARSAGHLTSGGEAHVAVRRIRI